MTAMEARLLSDSFEKAELLDAAAKQVKPKACRKLDPVRYLQVPERQGRKSPRDQDDRRQAGCSGQADRGGHHLRQRRQEGSAEPMFETDETVEAIVDRMGLKQVSDEGAILAIVQDVIAKNEKAVADFKAGKNVTGFLVGQCMKASKGQGNPQIINKLIASELAKL